MTKPEFDEWLGFHFSRFTGCAGWLGDFPMQPRFVGDPTQKSVVDGWRDTLHRIELAHAKTASQLLAIGEESFDGRGYDCHPRTVRAIAARLGGQERTRQKPKWKIVGDEEVFECGRCKDSGLVLLWHPTAPRFFKAEFVEQPPADWNRWHHDERAKAPMRRGQLYECCVVLCTCEVGMTKKSSAPRFDESKHVLFGDGDPRAAMESFLQTPAGGYGLDEEF